MTSDATGQIMVRRVPAAWRDVKRRYRITVDGETVGRIGNGGELNVPASPGGHTVQAHVGLIWKSEPVAVDVPESDPAVVSVKARPTTAGGLGALGAVASPGDYILAWNGWGDEPLFLEE